MPSLLATAVVAGAGISAAATLGGSSIQAGAANKAAQLQDQRYTQTRADLAPYTQGGQGQFSAYNALPAFNFTPSMSTLENLPGYQFTQTQGEKAVQNSASARGLGVSGAAMKGAASYATGLASTTWPELFNAQQGIYTTNANKLLQGATIGENAGAQTGTVGAQLANQAGGALITAGGAMGGGLATAGSTAQSALSNPYVLNSLANAAGASGGYVNAPIYDTTATNTAGVTGIDTSVGTLAPPVTF